MLYMYKNMDILKQMYLDKIVHGPQDPTFNKTRSYPESTKKGAYKGNCLFCYNAWCTIYMEWTLGH